MRRRVIINAGWLLVDKVVRLACGLIIWLWLARHLGPEGFGVWNYAIAIATVFATLAGLGLEGVVVRELVDRPHDADELLGTTFTLRLLAAVLSSIVCILVVRLLRPDQPLVWTLVMLNAFVFVVQSSLVFDLHFQARMHVLPSVAALNSGFLLATGARIVLLIIEAPVVWFAWSLVFEALVVAVLLITAYCWDGRTVKRWRFRFAVARHLVSESWPLFLSGLAVMAYMRLDQVMLAHMVSDDEVGRFSAALRISEVWYFIPGALVTAAFPALMEKRSRNPSDYTDFLQTLYDVTAWLGIIVAVVIGFAAPWLVVLLYGQSYGGAGEVLQVQIWAGVPVAMAFVHGKWLLVEGLQRYGLLYTVAAGLINVMLNLLLIPKYGAVGAAWATLASQTGPLFLQLILPRARVNFFMMVAAVWAPVRYANHVLSRLR